MSLEIQVFFEKNLLPERRAKGITYYYEDIAGQLDFPSLSLAPCILCSNKPEQF
jgi:hypothetical protein